MLNNKIVSLFTMLISVICIPLATMAAPSVSAVTGTVSRGGSVTITGSGFGTKQTASPVRSDFFEQSGSSYASGQPVTSGGWSTITAPQFITPIYSTSGAKNGSTKFARALHQTTGYAYQDSMFYHRGSTSLNRIYVTFYYRRTHVAGSETDNNKWFRIAQSAADGTGDAPCVFHTFLGSANTTGVKGEPNTSIKTYWTTMPPEETWIRWEGYYVKGTGGTANGTIIENAWFGEGRTFQQITHENGTAQTDTAGSASNWQDVIFGGYCNLGSLNGGADTSIVYYSDFDDIYIDNTQARVEIGNNANWNNCTRREIQIPTAWSNGSITMTVNSGSFSAGQTAYLFVVDADGSVSVGHPVVIGQGGQADTQAPRTPAGVSVTILP